MDAWICRPARALVIRFAVGGDRPVFVGLTHGPVVPAIGGLDLIGSGGVVALRVVCDGMMTYQSGRIRLDLATWAMLLVGAGADRRELDDRLCDLAVDLTEPGGYDRLREADSIRTAPRCVPRARPAPGSPRRAGSGSG
jgi:hypothetical protein